ncbi:unnamed protein product [Caretta caretta]
MKSHQFHLMQYFIYTDENERLKNNTRLLEEKLKVHEQEYKNQIDKLVTEIKNKDEEYKMELTKVHCDMSRKLELKEEEHKEKLEKKELTILDLTRQLRTLDKEKQNEIIKLQIEFNAKLARVQNKTTKSYPDTTVLPQNIYRRGINLIRLKFVITSCITIKCIKIEGIFPDVKMFSLLFMLSFLSFRLTVRCQMFHAHLLLVNVKQLWADVTVKIQ